MKKNLIEINGTIFKSDKDVILSDLIEDISKKFNGDDVKVEDCIFKGKKRYEQHISYDI